MTPEQLAEIEARIDGWADCGRADCRHDQCLVVRLVTEIRELNVVVRLVTKIRELHAEFDAAENRHSDLLSRIRGTLPG